MVTNKEYVQRVLDALGNQSRRDILDLLRGQPLSVGAIAQQLPVSRPAVSKHLRILEEAGLVDHHSLGTRNIFRLRAQGFDAARVYLTEFWDAALVNFQRVAEDAGRQERSAG